jgi:HSP20 family protein
MMSETTNAPAKTNETRPNRWDPFERLTQMQAEFDRFFGDRWPLRWLSDSSAIVSPKADMYEQNGSIIVKAELPGMKRKDIDVALEDGDLIIRGEQKTEEKIEEKYYYRMERSQGGFYRRLSLPRGVTADQIKATYDDGVLRVTVPKPSGDEPAQSKIHID